MATRNQDNLRDYISDIDDGYDTETELIAELDEFEITDETNGNEKPVWERLDNVMECPMNTQEVFWAQVRRRVESITRRICHRMWIGKAQGWKSKLAREDFSWENIFALNFLSSYFNALKAHILDVIKIVEWEPIMGQMVLFVAVELILCFYGISPTRYFEMQEYYPLMPSGGTGGLSVGEYHTILEYMGRPKSWQEPEYGKWKNPQLR